MTAWLPYALVALALVVSAMLAWAGSSLPGEAWAAVGLLVGVAIRRPGDVAGDS